MTSEASEKVALELLNELRAQLGEPVVALDLISERVAHELREAHALLTMLSSVLRNATGSDAHDDLRHNWNKAVRRRAWTTLPAFEGGAARPASIAPSGSNRPARPSDSVAPAGANAPSLAADSVRGFLAAFGVAFDAAQCSPQSLAQAQALCLELGRDVGALRALPLLVPDSYARRFRAISERWNELADAHSELPRLPAGR